MEQEGEGWGTLEFSWLTGGSSRCEEEPRGSNLTPRSMREFSGQLRPLSDPKNSQENLFLLLLGQMQRNFQATRKHEAGEQRHVLKSLCQLWGHVSGSDS